MLVIFNLLCALLTSVDALLWILKSPYSQYTFWILLILSFCLGHLVDKIAYLLFDHTLFAKHFQNRHATFDLPEWCQKKLEQKTLNSLNILPSKSLDLIDESKADWITAYFLVKARPELVQKRADLVANFQFTSNLLFVFLLAFLVLPAYFYFHLYSIIGAAVSLAFTIVAVIMYWRFSVASLMRINTFENLIVFGIMVDEAKQEENLKIADRSSAQEVLIPQQHKKTFRESLSSLFR